MAKGAPLSMNIEDEIERLTDLKHLGMALLQFSRSLRPGTFKKKRAAWIYSPNFVGFEIRYARVQRLNILVRPVPMPPDIQTMLAGLDLHCGPYSYGRAEISNARQLSAACIYIEASWRDWHRHILGEEPESWSPRGKAQPAIVFSGCSC